MKETDTESAVELESATPSPETSGQDIRSRYPPRDEYITLNRSNGIWSPSYSSKSKLQLLRGSTVRLQNVSKYRDIVHLRLKDASGNEVSPILLFESSSMPTLLDDHEVRLPLGIVSLRVRTSAPPGLYSLQLLNRQTSQRLSDIEVICDPKERDCTD